ncbi:FtsX-like permease family protein [Ulvibacterium marinum]|uniref:FtsX-like permease family protein n=1 Tax=Ulvibacterium marinum TaxID=2419782 RepID=A0A3B0C975_9FLAO|nr:FtsX-like permease family protein [Ulvibacterium marinum]RKN82915.1 FtsX-like permease family protein [Ulvibacterium marinum]
MFKNYLKIAFRNLWKNKVFSLINIIGLSIGLSAAFVIGTIIYFDLTFDKFHLDGERIYRVTTEFTSPDGNFYNPGVSVPLGQALKEEFAGIEIVSPLYTISMHQVENTETEKIFKSPENIIHTDGNYFQLFQYKWLAGDANGILSNPNEVVLTENRAKRYFPDLSPNEIVGKVLTYNDTISLNVTGVVENFKDRSDLIFEEFISYETIGDIGLKNSLGSTNWYSTNSTSQLFVKLSEKADVVSVQKQLDLLAAEHLDKEMVAFGQKRRFHLQPLADIHFNPNYGTYDYTRSQASKPVLISLSFVALFLLLLGCINFINLNTAQATQRAKEIGIRKTLGGSRKQLVFQFLGETFLLTVTAAVVSLFFSSWLIRLFSDFIPQGVSFGLFNSPVLIGSAILLVLVLTLLSGFYPALVLSRFKPVSVLKNQILPGNDKTSLRKYLTVFQFAIAQVFIIATVLVGKQIHYLMTKDMGFKTEAIAYLRTPYNEPSIDKRIRLLEKLKTDPHIQDVILGGNPPASRSTFSSAVVYRNEENEVQASLQWLYGGIDYRRLYGIPLLAGRDILNDTIKEYVINETYMKLLGFQEPIEAIGKSLILEGEAYPIVGVMKDFYQRSLRTTIKPMALVGDWYRNEYSQFNTIHFSIGGNKTSDLTSDIALVENAWKSIYPDYDFDPQFIDDTISRFYEQEHKTSALLKWATGLTILISCLGLLGLVIHTTERRTKEIGIRKVLGASLGQLNLLLCKEFLVLIGIAFVIAAPIAWWGLDYWLQGFAYKTVLSWWVFFLGGITMLFIAIAIISIRTIAAANANPVKSLRTE